MVRKLWVAVVCVLLVAPVEAAGPFRLFTRRPTYNNNSNSRPVVNAFLGSAQGVANYMASIGRIGHFGGNPFSREGVGMASTPDAAIRNCCFYGQYAVRDQGVAQGSNGMWYACCRY